MQSLLSIIDSLFCTMDYRLCSTDSRLCITDTLLFTTDNGLCIMHSLFFSRRTGSATSAACSARRTSWCPSLAACSARRTASFPRRTHGLRLGQQFLRDGKDSMSRAENGRRRAGLVCNKHQLLRHSSQAIMRPRSSGAYSFKVKTQRF